MKCAACGSQTICLPCQWCGKGGETRKPTARDLEEKALGRHVPHRYRRGSKLEKL